MSKGTEECNCDQVLELKEQIRINGLRWAKECDRLTGELEELRDSIPILHDTKFEDILWDTLLEAWYYRYKGTQYWIDKGEHELKFYRNKEYALYILPHGVASLCMLDT